MSTNGPPGGSPEEAGGGSMADPRGNLEHALEQALTLLAQKEAELVQTRRSEEHYRSLVEKVMDFVFCIDSQGRFTFVNSAVLSILGYRPEELLGQHFLSILSEDSRPVASEHFERNLKGRGPRSVYELDMLSKDERRVPMEIHGTNMYESGEVVGIRGIARDVSDRHRAEQRQEHYIKELQTLNQIGQQIASVLDLDELLPFIAQAILDGSDYRFVNVLLKDETGRYVVLKASVGDYGYPLPPDTRLKIGEEGIVGWVARTGKPMLVNDVTREPRYYATQQLQLTKSELTVPVKLGNQVVGVLDIQSDRLDAFDGGDLRSAKTLADQIAVALRNAQLFEAECRRREETSMILEVTRAVGSTLLIDEVMRLAASSIARAVGLADCGMYLRDETGDRFLPQDLDTPLIKTLHGAYERTPLEVEPSGFLREVVETRRPVISASADTDPRTNKRVIGTLGIKSLLAIPLVYQDRVLGVAMAATFEDYYEFEPEQVDLAAGIANSVAMAIENARLYERTRGLAVMEERNRLAREIHDTIAQSLTAIVLQLEAADHMMESNPEKAQMRMRKSMALARSSLQEARRSVWNLRPASLEDKKLTDAIREELGRLAEEAAWETSFDIVGDPDDLSGETENGLFRITQELLNNVNKHATATKVEVHLSVQDGAVRLRVMDNGVGFDPASARETGQDGGFGLLGARERARLLGGALRIESAPGQGTVAEAEIPFGR